MPAAEKHKLIYETLNYVISHAAARWYHCTTVNYRDSSVRGYHDKTVLLVVSRFARALKTKLYAGNQSLV
jgi:hypothetical protein